LVRLKILSGKQVCAILAQHGFEEVHRRGSHIAMQKKWSTSTITVPVPNHDEIRVGTLQGNMGPESDPQGFPESIKS
jgi:predicted RNA binding protein YcfA (HicA-like mRNA interferase family)